MIFSSKKIRFAFGDFFYVICFLRTKWSLAYRFVGFLSLWWQWCEINLSDRYPAINNMQYAPLLLGIINFTYSSPEHESQMWIGESFGGFADLFNNGVFFKKMGIKRGFFRMQTTFYKPKFVCARQKTCFNSFCYHFLNNKEYYVYLLDFHVMYSFDVVFCCIFFVFFVIFIFPLVFVSRK